MENLVWIIGSAAGGVAVGYVLNVLKIKATGAKAFAEAEKVKQDARREADQYLREAKVSAKADVLKMKEAAEEEELKEIALAFLVMDFVAEHCVQVAQ